MLKNTMCHAKIIIFVSLLRVYREIFFSLSLSFYLSLSCPARICNDENVVARIFNNYEEYRTLTR